MGGITMGLFGGKEGKEKKSPEEIYGPQIEELLMYGEEVERIYPLFIDFMAITNKRLIYVDKDLSLKDPKTTIYSTTFDKIVEVGIVKSEKLFSMTEELIIVTKGKTHELKFLKGTNMMDVYKGIVSKTL